jgi:hypothetical protein
MRSIDVIIEREGWDDIDFRPEGWGGLSISDGGTEV